MPGKKEHQAFGLLCGVGMGVLKNGDRENTEALAFVAGAGFGGWLTSTLADILDPNNAEVRNPRHRDLGHSPSLGLLFTKMVSSIKKEKGPHIKKEIDRLDEKNSTMSQDHPDRVWLVIGKHILHFVLGMLEGLPAGHFSHLFADLKTNDGLPFICRKTGLKWENE